MTPTTIIWHHTADPTKDYQLGKINRYHKSELYPRSVYGLYVGYHYLIEYDGSIVKCRSEGEIGAHDEGENFDTIGVGLAGDFSHELPTLMQEKAAARLVGQIMKRWRIPTKRIYPHRRNDTTACPGKLLPDNWLVKNYLKHEKQVFRKVGKWVCMRVNDIMKP